MHYALRVCSYSKTLLSCFVIERAELYLNTENRISNIESDKFLKKVFRQDQQARPGATPRWDAVYWKNQPALARRHRHMILFRKYTCIGSFKPNLCLPGLGQGSGPGMDRIVAFRPEVRRGGQ